MAGSSWERWFRKERAAFSGAGFGDGAYCWPCISVAFSGFGISETFCGLSEMSGCVEEGQRAQ